MVIVRYMRIVTAHDAESARQAYLETLARQGVRVDAGAPVFVEVIHRSAAEDGSWLCYTTMRGIQAA